MRKTAKQGIDGLEFQIVLQGAHTDLVLAPQPLISLFGTEYGYVKAKEGIAKIGMCLPKFVRNNNVEPFSITDFNELDVIRRVLEDNLTALFGDIRDWRLTKIECNITQQVAKGCTPSQVMNLINRSYHETTNRSFESASPKCKYQMEKGTLEITPKRNYYEIKCYDKSREQRAKKNLGIEDNLLRIELIMLDRTIKKLFGPNPRLEDILCSEGVMKVIEEYKRIFDEDIVDAHVKPCMKGTTNFLFESLTQTDSPIETIAQYREIITDIEILRRALKKWYNLRDMEDNSRQLIYSFKKYNLPKNVAKTIREFHHSCG